MYASTALSLISADLMRVNYFSLLALQKFLGGESSGMTYYDEEKDDR